MSVRLGSEVVASVTSTKLVSSVGPPLVSNCRRHDAGGMSAACGCPATSSTADMYTSARCLLDAVRAVKRPCAHNETSAARVCVLGLHCVSSAEGQRGFFLLSRTAESAEVCTGGDVFRAWVLGSHDRTRFSTYATPVEPLAWPSLYWVNTTGSTPLPGRSEYAVSVVLIETQRRALQLAERRGPLQFSLTNSSPATEWFRDRRCIAKSVPLPPVTSTLSGAGSNGGGTVLIDIDGGRPQPRDRRCRWVPPSSSSALVALDEPEYACGRSCTGDAKARVIHTFLGPKDVNRSRVGFRHVLKPEGCHYHWFDEAELTRCLGGRSILNVGCSVANSLQRGFERISSNEEHKREWWWRYGRTGITGDKDLSPGTSVFNRSVISTQFIHNPFRYGLVNVVAPNPKRVVSKKSAADWEKYMCHFDIVVFESGVHDLASPDRSAHRAMLQKCSLEQPCTDADLLPNLHNESWRLRLLDSYRTHLHQLVGMWQRCRDKRLKQGHPRPFRPIFKLSTAPNPGMEMKSCTAEWGYNTVGWYLSMGNQVARQVVEAAGFEVFDPFPLMFHSASSWFDKGGSDSLHSDVLSDLVTQMLINQICEHRERARSDE